MDPKKPRPSSSFLVLCSFVLGKFKIGFSVAGISPKERNQALKQFLSILKEDKGNVVVLGTLWNRG